MADTDKTARIAQLRAMIAKGEISEANGATPQKDEHGATIVRTATCGTCGLSWNDALISGLTPAPSGRCPYEYLHPEIAELARLTQPEAAVAAPLVYQCGDCGWEGTADELDGIHHIHHIYEVLKPGELVPAGVCPNEECRAVIYCEGPEVPAATLDEVARIMQQRGWKVEAPCPLPDPEAT
jgi:hypothetical protein